MSLIIPYNRKYIDNFIIKTRVIYQITYNSMITLLNELGFINMINK